MKNLMVILVCLILSGVAGAGTKENFVAATLRLEQAILKAKAAEIGEMAKSADKGTIYGTSSRLADVRTDEFGISEAYAELIFTEGLYRSLDITETTSGDQSRIMFSLKSQIGELSSPFVREGKELWEVCQKLSPSATSNWPWIVVCDTDRIISDLKALYRLLSK